MKKCKFNVRPSDCRYIVNKEKRTIVCLIEHTENMFTKFAETNFAIPYDCLGIWWGDKKPTYQHFYKKLYMPKRFWGIATCAEEDEWDENKGKLLAFAKAKNKLNNSFFKRAQLYVDTMDKSLNDAILILNNLGDKLTKNTEHRQERIKELLGDIEDGVSAN